jgi:hypothetical protein
MKKRRKTINFDLNKWIEIIENELKIEHIFPKKATNIINAIKSEIIDAVVKCCVLDLRSFSLIEEEGFKLLAQKLIYVGARYGLLKGQFFPHITTIWGT